jgi:hypothetical protein
MVAVFTIQRGDSDDCGDKYISSSIKEKHSILRRTRQNKHR